MEQTHTGEELIKVGMVVKYLNPEDKKKNGHYRVTRVTKTTVNLATIFGGRICYKQVPLSQVTEDEASWYEGWTRSETYMSM